LIAVEIEIRPLAAGEIEEVHAIEVASFSSPWRLRTFYDALSSCDHFRSVTARDPDLREPSPILGYAAWFDLGEEYHIISLAVHPGHRRRKIATRLLAHIDGLARAAVVKRLTLEVRVSNEAAIAFYGARGFIPVAVKKDYYEDNGEDALVMWINR
jgi:[ribosomal protein S18]-alanine N-acetyltransferase